MKNKIILIASILLISMAGFAQEIKPAPENKAVLYFVRASSMGFAINFSYFDSTSFIGKFNGVNYFRYECEPGRHLFWARSENRDFINADLEAGKIYFVNAIPQMGALKAGVQLVPVDTKNEKVMKPILKLLSKKEGITFTPEELKLETDYVQDIILRGMDKHKENMAKGETYPLLTKSMFYQMN